MSDQNIPVTADSNVQIDCDNNDNNTDRYIQFSHDNGTELMRIQENGNVGIGTNNPRSLLQIDSSSSDHLKLRVHTESYTTDYVAGLGFGVDTVNQYMKSAIVHQRKSSNGEGDLLFCVDSNNDGANVAVSDEKMRIDSDGNVGIGTTNPGAKLEIGGDMIVSDGSGNESIIIVDAPSTGAGAASANRTKIQNAIDAVATTGGGSVILQSGTYVVEENGSNGYAIELKDGVHLRGASMVDTIIQADSGESEIDIIRFGTTPQTSYVIASVKNLCIDGNSQNDIVGINLGNYTNNDSPQPSWIENVRIINIDSGQSGTGTLSTSGTSTTVSFSSGDAYNAVNIGTALIAGNKLRIIISKDGSNNVTVNRAVDWSTATSFEYSDYRAGIVVASWFSEINNCEFEDCDIGIKLFFKYDSSYDSTNCTMINHCHFWTEYIGVYIDGSQNVIYGCNIGGIKDGGVGIEISNRGSRRSNYINGNYIESDSGNTDAKGIYIPANGNGSTILGNFFDLVTSGNEIEISGSPNGNVILSNYNGRPTTKVLNCSIDSNVGIGTASPDESLHVYGGQANIALSGDSYPTLQILNYSHDNVSINFDSYYRSGWKSSDAGSNFRIYKIVDKLYFSYASGVSAGNTISDWASQDSNVALAIDNSGKVGIGTTSPNSLLHVKPSTSGDGIRVEAYNHTDRYLHLTHGDAGAISGTNDLYFFSGSGSDINFCPGGGGTVDVTFKGGGNVGIGTDSPSSNADLTLEGGALCIKETTTPTADTNYGKIYTKSDNKLYFQDGAGTEHEIAFV